MLIPIDLYPVVTKHAIPFISSQPADSTYKWLDYKTFKQYAKSIGKTPVQLGVKKLLDHKDINGDDLPTGGVYIITDKTSLEVSYYPCANQCSGAVDIIWNKYKDQFDNYVAAREQAERIGR